MRKAVLHNGRIEAVEPLPVEWQNGQELRVDKADDRRPSAADIDRDFAELERLCSEGDPQDDEMLRVAIEESRRQSKEQVRRQMGLT